MSCALELQNISDSIHVGSFYWEVRIKEHNEMDLHHCSCTFCIFNFGTPTYTEITAGAVVAYLPQGAAGVLASGASGSWDSSNYGIFFKAMQYLCPIESW